ncbi:MAG: cytochrome c biogenesis protein CcdA [Phycisphaerales bacterium]
MRKSLATRPLWRTLIAALTLAIALPAAGQPGSPFGNPANQTASRPDSRDDAPVQIEIEASRSAVAPGGEFIIAVIINHSEHWHTNLNQPIVPEEMGDFYPVPTTLALPTEDGIEFGPIQWPQPTIVGVDFTFTGTPIDYQVYSDQAVIYLPVRINQSATPGQRTLQFRLTYQACDDTVCLPPETATLTVPFNIVPQDDLPKEPTPAIFDAYDPDADSTTQPQQADDTRQFLGFLTLPDTDSPLYYIVLALLAAVGGFVLNLTPCVLPVIPIKVMTISQHAHEKRSRAFFLAAWMAAGVIAFWVAIGIPMAFIARELDPSMIFGYWWLTALIGLVILAMGVGIMGLFEIKLPQQIYMINPKADSLGGSFVYGVMTAVLGLPCFGFVAGALLAGAATMPSMLVLTIFAFMGIGMALPYVVLAMFPALLSKLPRTGPASELVKQVMGLLMIAAAAYFLGTSFISYGSGHGWTMPWWGKAIHWWAIGLLGLTTGFWLIARTFRITKGPAKRALFTLVGFFFAFSGSFIAYGQTTHLYNNFWQPYSRESLAAALDNGQIVVLDFTAEWCLNCKALEATVLAQNPVKPQLLRPDVVPMVADLTSLSAPGWSFLNNDLGQTGIPFLAIFAPGSDDPVWVSNAYTSSQVLTAIETARTQRDQPN